MSAVQPANIIFHRFPVSWPTIQNHFKRQIMTRVSLNLRVTVTEDTSESHGLPTAHFQGSSTTPIGPLDITGSYSEPRLFLLPSARVTNKGL